VAGEHFLGVARRPQLLLCRARNGARLAPLPPPRREAIDTQFIRVFAGEGTAADVNDMAKQYGCEVVVVVPQDKAWDNDPFAASTDYRLAENRDGRWRIYVRAK